MLDYEIIRYEVEYHRIGSCSTSSAYWDTEEAAIDFIKDCRHKWDRYKLIKIQAAVIDF